MAIMPSPSPTSVLVVTDRIAVSPELLGAIRTRAARGPIEVRLLVPNPAPAEWHPGHPERHAKAEAAQRVLEQTLPQLRHEAGIPVDGSVSTRHDPLDAIEGGPARRALRRARGGHRAASRRRAGCTSTCRTAPRTSGSR